MQISITFCKTARELGAWHDPCWKFPQLPDGVPKLANLMAEMEYPAVQCRLILGPANPSCSPMLSACQLSETLAQTVVTDLFGSVIFNTSPPISSKTTNRFLDGFNQARGTWYLT